MILASPKRFLSQEIAKIIATLISFWQLHRGSLLRSGMILVILILAPVIGILVAKVNPLFVLILVAAPIGLLALHLILPRFELAPLIILFAAAFVPLELPTGTESRLVDSLLLTLLFTGNWLLKMLLVDKQLKLQPSPVNKPLLIFFIITIVSLIWSMVLRDPLVIVGKSVPIVQTASAVVMIMLPCAFLLVANLINQEKWLKLMVVIMLAAGAIGISRRLDLLPFLTFINDGGLFTMWVVGLSVSMALFNRALSWKWRIALVALAGGWIYFRFGDQITWLAGWLPTFIVLAVIIFMYSKKFFFTMLVAATIFVSFNADYYLGKVLEDESAESGHTRTAAWEVNWRVTGKHLLFGTGPGGYATYYMSYFPHDAMATHSNYIDIIAQTGIFGLLFSVMFFLILAWLGYKLCLRLKQRNDFAEGLANAAFAGTIGCIVAMAFGDWLFPFAYTQTIAGFDFIVYSWLFMGSILVLDRLYPAQIKNQTPLTAHPAVPLN
jgi:O-antigen ligase